MKHPVFIFIMALLFASWQSRTVTESSITGKVVPADGLGSVWVISGTDSLKATASDGAFSISVKEGRYKIIVDAREPYKDVTVESVEVRNGQNTDIGEIRLQQ